MRKGKLSILELTYNSKLDCWVFIKDSISRWDAMVKYEQLSIEE